MRWEERFNWECSIGDLTVCEKFLWLPICIKGEWRWLENAKFYRKLIGTKSRVDTGKVVPMWENVGWKNW